MAQTLGQILRKFRDDAKLTQFELADKSGLSRPTIASLETDARHNVQSDTIEKLAKALGKTYGDFFPAKQKQSRTAA